MDGFEKRRDEKKRAILQTALELFDQYGFGRVTVAEIAEKAHVSKVSIYNFFESKDNLRRIIVREILDNSLRKERELIESKKDFIDKVREYLRIRTWYYGKYGLRFFFDAVESDPELRRTFDAFTTENKRLVMDFIWEGKRSGVFTQEASDDAIEICIDMIQSYFLNNREIRGRMERNPGLAQELNLLFFDGLIRGKKSGEA